MKTVDKLAGSVRLTFATGASEDAFVLSADPLGLWTDDDVFIPWAAIDRVEVNR